jgi:hypothetical protein
MIFEIRPRQGVNDLEFGETRDAVRQRLGAPSALSRRARPTDNFDAGGVQAAYDNEGRLEAIVLVAPAQAVLDGEDLLALGFAAAEAILRARDPALRVGSDGATSYALGVGIYASAAEEFPGEPVEAVIVFRDGYYDGLDDAGG